MKRIIIFLLFERKLLIPIVLYFIILIIKIINKYKFKIHRLESLGFWENQTVDGIIKKIPPKGYIDNKKARIVFTRYNPQIISKIENLEFISSLGAIYSKKFINGEIKHKKFFSSQSELVFYYENLPDNLTYSDKPSEAIYPNLWFGRNTKNQDLILNCENAHGILVLSRAGGGKGVLARTLINQFPNHNKIVIDDKGTDFLDILSQEEYFNPTDIEEFRQAVEKIENYINECEIFKMELKKNGTQISHWNQLENRPMPYLILLDEMAQYMKLQKNGNKEREELKLRLINGIEKILQLYRVSGTVVIGMSQSSNQMDYDLSFNNFAIRVYSKQNAQQSVNLVGSTLLNEQSLFSGIFYLTSPKIETKFKAPDNSIKKTNG